MESQALSSSSQQSNLLRYVCVCRQYNYGRPHMVSEPMFYRHLEQVTSNQEQQDIRSAKAMTLEMASALFPFSRFSHLPENCNPLETVSGLNQGLSRGTRWAITLQGLAKRARDNDDTRGNVGRRKRARVTNAETDVSETVCTCCHCQYLLIGITLLHHC
jgi:hypothetical protein